MKYLFVLNPISGPKNRVQKLVHRIDNIFRETENYYEFVFTTGPGDATKIAQQGAADGFDFRHVISFDHKIVGTTLWKATLSLLGKWFSRLFYDGTRFSFNQRSEPELTMPQPFISATNQMSNSIYQLK